MILCRFSVAHRSVSRDGEEFVHIGIRIEIFSKKLRKRDSGTYYTNRVPNFTVGSKMGFLKSYFVRVTLYSHIYYLQMSDVAQRPLSRFITYNVTMLITLMSYKHHIYKRIVN